MPLKYVIAEIAAATGFHPDTVPADRTYLISQINKAAKEMHESKDLINCNREQLFMLSPQTQQVSLPHSVFQLRGIRNYYTRRQVTLHDMRPRFQSSGWTENLLTWRDKFRSPTQRELLNFAPLTLSITQPEVVDFNVAISGSTPYAERVTELVTFYVGDTSKSTTNGFTSIESISNTSQHVCDVTIADADGNTIAVLPNCENSTDYRVVQVLDYVAVAPSSPYMVEVLFKIRFRPLFNDFDEFCCPGYDDALIWKVLSFLYARKDPEKAALCDGKSNQIQRQRADDAEQAVEKLVEFTPNDSMYLHYRARRYHRNLFPGSYPY